MIEVICSYCGKSMGQKDGKGQTGVSHGICSECLEEQLKKLEE